MSDPYEAPESPEIHIKTEGSSPEESAQAVVKALEEKGLVNPKVGA